MSTRYDWLTRLSVTVILVVVFLLLYFHGLFAGWWGRLIGFGVPVVCGLQIVWPRKTKDPAAEQ